MKDRKKPVMNATKRTSRTCSARAASNLHRGERSWDTVCSCHTDVRSKFPPSHVQTLLNTSKLGFAPQCFAPVATMQGSEMRAFHGQGLSSANIAKCLANRCLQERNTSTESALKNFARSCARRCIFPEIRNSVSRLRRWPAI